MAIARDTFDSPGKVYLCALSLCFFSVFCPILQANELVNVNIHDQVYAFVKRLVTRNLLEKRLYNTQPLTRREIAEALIEITEKNQSGRIELTDVEEKHLKYYQRLFGDEIETINPGFLPPLKKIHTVTIEGEDYEVNFDFKTKQELAHTKPRPGKGQETSITSLDFIFQAKLGRHLGILSVLHDRLLLGSASSYHPYDNEVSYDLRGESRTFNAMEGYIILDLRWLALLWGIDEAWWGPGRHGALMISDNSAPKDTFKISGLYGPLKFTYLTSILREDMLEEYQPRYMSAHRLEFVPYRGISVGLNEVMLFADRYDLRYLNPFIIFYTLQTENCKDNGLLGIDLDITLPASIGLYTELMVDDFQTSEGWEAFRVWNSKYGALVGLYCADPFGWKDTDLSIEYAFVNQYAYTYEYEAIKYTHEDFIIGHWIGTDADDIWFDVRRWFNDNIRGSLIYERERHGEGNVRKRHPLEIAGSDIADPPEHWEFLSGVTEATHSFSLGLSYISIGSYSTSLEYTHSRIRNANNESGVREKKHQLVAKAEYYF